MPRAPVPVDEPQRLDALRRYGILDTASEPSFDRMTALASRIFRVPIALVSLVDADRQWFKACIGLNDRQTGRDVAFCAHAILLETPLVVPDAARDSRFAENPLVTGPPHIRFYAGAPLRTPDGFAVGTLCIIDTAPRSLSEDDRATLVDLAALVVDELEDRTAYRQLEAYERALADAKRAVEEKARLMEVVFDSVGEGISVADGSGELTMVNRAAREMVGVGVIHDPASAWPEAFGIFSADGTERFPADRIPLVRAVRGEATDAVEMLVRNPHVPNGVLLSVTGRPLLDSENRVHGGVVTFSDITSLRAAEEELARLAITDEMTRLPNLRAFRERLLALIREGERGRRFALVIVDIDHFKVVNDTHGHKTGDEVLIMVARTLQQSVRKTDFVARYGGEEFCVLLVDVDEHRAVQLAEKLRLAVEAAEGPVKVTASFGVCENVGMIGRDPDELVRTADAALYRAKRSGRNRVISTQDCAVDPSQ